MRLSSVARWPGKAALAVKLSIRTFTRVDTNPVPGSWNHITKVDPENSKKLPLLYPLYLQHTSAVSVGGSRDVDSENTEETFELLDGISVPILHEPSDARHVTEKTREYSRFLLIPEVLNGDSKSLVGTLGEGTAYLKDEMVPNLIDRKLSWLPSGWKPRLADFLTSWFLESAIFEAYIIQNVDSAAAREAHVTADDLLEPREAAQRALAAEKHLESPVIYLEYSGTFGGDEASEILTELRGQLSWSRIWYGGGIHTRQQTSQVLDAGADTVIVGNVFHKVALEEGELVDRAGRDLDSEASTTEIADWIDSEFEIEDTSAYGYLVTIPQIDNPVRLARDYLATTIRLHVLILDLIESSEPAGFDPSDTEMAIRERMDLPPGFETIPPHTIDLIQEFLRSHSASDGDADGSLLSHVSGLER